ncbi:ABC transporter ATP-binding protein [Limisphaera sp. VF-2]|uniref:ABC transporter ATP-binding protein n=1 Tax=Limisphaera sp. VF-2 TaxID=3400418 RepID=UPI003C15981D
MQQETLTVASSEPAAGAEPEPPHPAVECQNLVRRFGSVTALSGVSFAIRKGEFFSLLGPSGCGKTTLLRVLAGLDRPDAGWVRLDGVEMTRTPPHRRPVNTVFQSYALFPHLNVWDNVAFGLRMKGVAAGDVEERVRSALRLVQIEGLEHRRPAQLSGGQQQRVALARALVNEPLVLLLDEPLGALDLQLRRQLQTELRQLQRRLGLTFLHVTHDQEEALALSDRVAVMRAGRIEQLGTPRELYEQPRNRFVARFLGQCNLIEGECLPQSAFDWRVDTPWGLLEVRPPGARTGRMETIETPPRVSCRNRVTLAIRPERIQLLPAGPLRQPLPNQVVARIQDRVYTGAAVEYRVVLPDQSTLTVSLPNDASPAAACQPGQRVICRLPPEALIPLDD